MFKPLSRKILLTLSVLSFVSVFFGLGSHAFAADYAKVESSGWTFTAQGVTQQQFNEGDKSSVLTIIANKDQAGQDQYAVFYYSKTTGGVREYVQRPDYYSHAGDTRACAAHIDLETSGGFDQILATPIGCNPATMEWKTDGITITATTPADIVEKAKLENFGKAPAGCQPTATYGSLTGAPDTTKNYNCPSGTGSVQNGMYTSARIAAVTTPVDPTAGDGDEFGMTDCDVKLLNPISWVMCPLIDAVFAAVRGLDSIITQLLIVDTAKVFSSGNASLAADDPNLASSNAYYEAWSSFRAIALGLVVIASLIIIIASAFGLEILDAYTIKKALPRVFIAIIGIAISWEVCEFFINLSNDIGVMVRSLIYTPFANTPSLQIDGIGKLIYAVLLTGAWFVWGPAVLTFGGVALLGVTIALLILIAREMILIFCVIVAPVAIALFILPNTQKYWQLWQNTFTTLLIVFPIISGFIAMGRVFSAIAYQAGTASFYMELISFVAYFLPYFMIPFAFKMAGGIMATISGIGSDKSRGAFDRMRKMRQDTAASRKKDVMEGTDDAGTGKGLNRAMGSVYRRTALAGKGGMSVTQKGRDRYKRADKQLRKNLMAERFKAEGGDSSGDDDVTQLAMEGANYNQSMAVLTRKYQAADSSLSDQAATARARDALAGFESGFGVKMGSSGAMLAGLNAQAMSDTSLKDGVDIEADNKRLLDAGVLAVQRGLISQTDFVAKFKSNKARPERANMSFGATYGAMSDALARASVTGGNATIDASVVAQLTSEAVDGTGPQDLINAKPEQVKKIGTYLSGQMKELAATKGIESEEYQLKAATFAAIHETLTYASPQRAEEFVASALSTTIAEEGNKTIRVVLDEFRTGQSAVVNQMGQKIDIEGNVIQPKAGTRKIKVLRADGQVAKDSLGYEIERVVDVDSNGNEIKPQAYEERKGREKFLDRKYTYGSEAGQRAAQSAQQAGIGVPPTPPTVP